MLKKHNCQMIIDDDSDLISIDNGIDINIAIILSSNH